MARSTSHDFIIVGAGSAGCALAARLSEDAGVSVLLLEAGGWDRDPWIHIPLGWPYILLNRKHDWMYFAEPEATMDGRGELAPGPKASRDAIDAHIRATGITVHHPLGTCRMGQASDSTSVVDPELRVLGTERLRVVDASVMPDLIGGNINAAVIMIAEKAADLIIKQPTSSHNPAARLT